MQKVKGKGRKAKGANQVMGAAMRMARLEVFGNFKIQNPNFRKGSKFRIQPWDGGSA
jgi:hypothetical protein